MDVLLTNDLHMEFKIDKKFINRYPFVKEPASCEFYHSRMENDTLYVDIDHIDRHGILDGPNGVFPSLAERDGSLAGSVPHDVVWEYVQQLAKFWKVGVSKVRKFGDDIYVNTVFAYGGKTWWTRLTNRFCYKVAFPFGNFLKKHNLKLPTYAAPFIVIALFPIALWMFLFNKSYCKMEMVNPPEIKLLADGKQITLTA